MAPKEKAAEKKSEKEPVNTDDDKSISMETELLVSFLRTKMGRYQELGERLQLENFQLMDELDEERLTLKDINEFLTNELKARSLGNAQLEEKLVALHREQEEAKKKWEGELARLRSERAREAESHAALVEVLQRQADASGNWVAQKEALEGALATAHAARERQQKEHEARITELERQQLAEKERWRKETAARIRETKAAMAQLADNHLEQTTKRTMLENDAMAAELGYHAAASQRLVSANAALRGEATELRRQLAVAEHTADSLSRKNLLLQRTIKAILGRLQGELPHWAAQHATTAAVADGGGVSGSGDTAASSSQVATTHEALVPQEDCIDPAAADAATTSSQEQQQQQQPSAAASAAADVMQHLEQRVLTAQAELEAAKTALAAAVGGLTGLTGWVPAGLITSPGPGSPAVAAAGGAGGGGAGSSSKDATSSTCLPEGPSTTAAAAAATAVRGPSGSPSSPSKRRGAASSSKGQRRGQQSAAAAGGSPATGLSAACDDGVAPFVLWCVHRLRRQAAEAAVLAAGSTTEEQQQQQRRQQLLEAEVVDADGWGSCVQGWEGLPAPAREALAQFLLEQLHSYTPSRFSAYQGLFSSTAAAAAAADPGGWQGDAGHPDQHHLGAGATAAGGLQLQLRIPGAPGWLGPAAAAAGGGVGGSPSPSSSLASPGSTSRQRQQGTTPRRPRLQLPPLPGLLSPGVTSINLAAAGGPASPDPLDSPAGIQALLQQVLGEVRPWGGSTAQHSSTAAGSGAPGRLPRSPGKSVSPTKAGAAPSSSSPDSRGAGHGRMGSPLLRGT